MQERNIKHEAYINKWKAKGTIISSEGYVTPPGVTADTMCPGVPVCYISQLAAVLS